jgi:hypothetical protein
MNPDAPWAFMIHGLGGIGKTTLLNAIGSEARDKGRRVVSLDCATIEPTEAGFITALADALGAKAAQLDELRRRVDELDAPLILTLDRYENFRLMDSWLRQSFLPAMAGQVRILIAGRSAPLLQWTTDPLLGPRFRSLKLSTLSTKDSAALLADAGVDPGHQEHILRLAHGHPLALRLAAVARAELSGGSLDDLTIDRVLRELTRFYVAEIENPQLRAAVEAASTVRRVNATTLAAMLELDDVGALYDEFEALHFVEPRRDGLSLHDAVKEFVSAELHSRDPSRFAGYRRAAWQQMRQEIKSAPAAQLWRYTADLIYLIENPVVREAFFPSTELNYAVEPAKPEDFEAIVAISSRHEPVEAVDCLRYWWSCSRQSFYVAREGKGDVVGFYCSLDSTRIDPAEFESDPLTRAWWADLRKAGVAHALFLRRWLSRDDGESPSPVQAACWLDLKRSYLELRPDLRRVYLTLQDLQPYLAVALRLGFAPVADATVELGGRTYVSAALDFGPDSVDGWMRRLFAHELGESESQESAILDLKARQLVGPAGRQDLSPLEFGVMKLLIEREGDPVSREQLLAEVWNIHYDGSSNVVDTVIRALRKKLGERADSIESVRGVGYRYLAGQRAAED